MIVRNILLLKRLEYAGFIKLHEHTGCKLGDTLICYIDDYTVSGAFQYKGNKFKVSYVDGCFFPYVFHT